MIRYTFLIIMLCFVPSLHAGMNNGATSSWVDPKPALKIGFALGALFHLTLNEFVRVPVLKEVNRELETQRRNNRTSHIRLRSDSNQINVMIDDYNRERITEATDSPANSRAFGKLNSKVNNRLSVSTRTLDPAFTGLFWGLVFVGAHQAASWLGFVSKGSQ